MRELKNDRTAERTRRKTRSSESFLISCTKLSKEQVDDIKTELKQKKHNAVDRLSNRLGVDTFSIKRKIGKLEVLENLSRISRKVKRKRS